MRSVIKRFSRTLISEIGKSLCVIVVLVASTVSQKPPTKWAVAVYFEPKFPPGVWAPLHVEIVYPEAGDITLHCFKPDDCSGLQLQGDGTKLEARPSHIIFRVSAYDFQPQVVNTGIIQWYVDSRKINNSTLFVPLKFQAEGQLPTLEHVVKLSVQAPRTEVLEASVFNPTTKQINLTSLRISSVLAIHKVSCLADFKYPLFKVNIKVDGLRLSGTLRQVSPPDNFAYELSGEVINTCGEFARLDSVGRFDYPIKPNERAVIRLNVNDEDREKALQALLRSPNGHEFSARIGDWQVEFQVDEKLWLSVPSMKH